MEITSKIFWREALKSGTIIGIVTGCISMLQSFMESPAWSSVLGWLYYILLALLIYAFTRKIARMSRPSDGFPYGRCIGYVFAMMIFAGVVMGLITSLTYNVIAPGMLTGTLDTTFGMLEGMYSYDDMDRMYDMMYSMMRNPLVLILSGIITMCFWGGLFGLVTSAIAQRKPQPFAEDGNIQE